MLTLEKTCGLFCTAKSTVDKGPKTYAAQLLHALGLPHNCAKAVITLEPGDCIRAELTFATRGNDLAQIKRYQVTAREIEAGPEPFLPVHRA